MKVVVQRVKESSVTIDGSVYGQIQKGFMVLVGFCQDDTKEIVDKIVDKMIGLRVFEDENGKMNLSLQDVHGLSLIHISEPTRQAEISYAVFCLKKKKKEIDRQ